MEAQNNQVHLAEGDGQHGPVQGPSAAKVLLAFARMGAVMEALRLLVVERVIAPESLQKGIRKFIKDNPVINEHLARDLDRKGGAA